MSLVTYQCWVGIQTSILDFMSYKFESSKYKNHQEALDRVEKYNEELRGCLIRLSLDYTNKISGEMSNDDFYQLRESVFLRLESVLFHYDILASINISGEKLILGEDYPNHDTHIIALHQDFLFDSIIFNVLSLFDYTSCLIKFLIENNKQKKKLLWAQLAKTARGNDNFKNTTLANAIDRIDRGWVNRLSDYRAELIHYKDDSSGWKYSCSPMKNEIVKHVYAPINLKNHFKELKNCGIDELNINATTLWIVENSYSTQLKIEV